MGGSDRDGVGRRGALECMVWAGAGVLWTMSGGVPRSALIGAARRRPTPGRRCSFVQISDSHIGFNNRQHGHARHAQEAIAAGEPQKGDAAS